MTKPTLESVMKEFDEEFEGLHKVKSWTHELCDCAGMDTETCKHNVKSFFRTAITSLIEATRVERPKKIEYIHANFNRNGLVEETADKINEIIEAVNALSAVEEQNKRIDEILK